MYDIEEKYNNDESRVAFVLHVKKREKAITWLLLEKDTSPEIYVRDEGATVHPSIEEIQELLIKSNFYEFDKTITGDKAFLNDFSYLDIEYRQANNNKPLTEKILKSFNLISNDNKLTIAGLLFKDDSEYKNANLVCNVWPSITKGTDNYVDSKTYNGSIITLINGAINYIKSVNYYVFGGKKVGMLREDIGSFSIVVLREALVNAFAHRDYKIDGNEVCLDCYPDRIEISSPGAMLQSGYERKIQKLESVVSQRRNQTICDVFVSCKMMEKKGSGFDKIIDDYKSLSDDYFPLCITTRSTFTIVLKNKKYKLNKIRTQKTDIELEENNSLLLSTDAILSSNESLKNIYVLIKSNPKITYDVLAKEIGLSREGVKYNIKKLKELLLIKKMNKHSDFIIIDDINRPCSIMMLDIDLKNEIIVWINNNLSTKVNVESDYDNFINKTSFLLTKEQFIGALLLTKYKPLNKEMNVFIKNIN